MTPPDADMARLEGTIDHLMRAFGAPSWGRAAARTADPAADLSPEEAFWMKRSVDRRRREFAAGRRCAKTALKSIGKTAVSIPRGMNGEPVWPSGATGSIAHDGRYAVAVAADRRQMLYGVDLIDRDNFCHVGEAMTVIRHPLDDWVAVADARSQAEYFAAKEVAVKIMSPALRSLIDIEELRVARRKGGLVVASRHWPHEIAVNAVYLDDALLALGCSLDFDEVRSLT